MSPAIHDAWTYEDEFFCAHCLTELDCYAARCYRCDASFHGSGRFDLVSGKPHLAGVFHQH